MNTKTATRVSFGRPGMNGRNIWFDDVCVGRCSHWPPRNGFGSYWAADYYARSFTAQTLDDVVTRIELLAAAHSPAEITSPPQPTEKTGQVNEID